MDKIVDIFRPSDYRMELTGQFVSIMPLIGNYNATMHIINVKHMITHLQL